MASMLYKVLSCVLFYVLVNIISTQVNGQAAVSSNDLIDQVLDTIKRLYKHQIDPMKLPDEYVDLEDVLGIFGLGGEANLRNGTLEGASYLERNGECSIDHRSSILITKLKVGTGHRMKMKYRAKYEILGLKSHEGDVTAEAEKIDLNVTIRFSPTTGQLVLTHFEIEKMEKLKIKLEDNDLIEPWTELFSETYGRVYHKQYNWAFSKLFSGVLGEAIANFTLPYGVLNGTDFFKR